MEEKYIVGKFKKIIYENKDSNYYVTLFKLDENDETFLKGKVSNLIHVTGSFPNLNLEAKYKIYGSLINHPKYSWQFNSYRIEVVMPTTKEELIKFFESPFVEGCSKVFAKKIVDTLGVNAIKLITEDINNLFKVKGMTTLKSAKIYGSLQRFEMNETLIKTLISFGFNYEEASKVLNKHYSDITPIIEGNLYLLKDIFEFKKLDDIYKNKISKDSPLRCKECLLNTLCDISFSDGSTYYYKDEIYKYLNANYEITLSDEDFDNYLESLINDNLIIKDGLRYYLKKYYDEEKDIARYLYLIDKQKKEEINDFDEQIKLISNKTGKEYSKEQLEAIKNSLTENISIISGGPGTGKTTIIDAIVKFYIEKHNLNNEEVISNITLLAPTGRASKKLSCATGLGACTIHRLLRWHKEDGTFEYNEHNKLYHKLVIVDECSMIDVSLMRSLLCAYNSNIKLILVGDIYQLPSVGPGLVLHDLIDSDVISYNILSTIYRQSDNSYIPYLAKDIKAQNLEDDFTIKRDDYSFIVCPEQEILSKVVNAAKYALTKGIDETKMQVLAPMYKGINGIDNLNLYLEKIYNKDDSLYSVKYGDKTYKIGDKVLQLINDADNNVFNGDIGKIINIFTGSDGKIKITIDFDGNIVFYEKKDLKNITLAYAITIHKSQGSEFEHVIMPISKGYNIMLYNKLIYTGVSRAKKSLTIIGDPSSFIRAIQNNYSSKRKTSLKEYLQEYFNE